MSRLPGYRHCDVVLVRASTEPGDLELPSTVDVTDTHSAELHGVAWLSRIWSRPDVRDVVRLASPGLAARVTEILDAGAPPTNPKAVRSAVVSMASYILRWQGRATPFGRFAGVAVANVGPAEVAVDAHHCSMARVDAEWLCSIIERLAGRPALLRRLHVVADNNRFLRDRRVIVHPRAALGADSPGPLRESSVRHTRPVECALSAARSPVRFDDLAARLVERFTTTPRHTIEELLHGLLDAGLLILELQAPMTGTDPLAHLVSRLRDAGGHELPDLIDFVHVLETIDATLAEHNATANPAHAGALREDATRLMSALTGEPRPTLAVDTRLNARITLPEPVLTEAAHAADVLLRTTTQPYGSTAWLDYHARFRARYGEGALVPVRDLVADSGLGYPTGYLGAPRARPSWRTLTDRDARLLAMIQHATLHHGEEIILSEADVAGLTVANGDETFDGEIALPDRIELGVILNATSTTAIDRGDFALTVVAAPRTPTSMIGRFTHLFTDDDRARLAATFAHKHGEPLAVQLSFPPRRPHNDNITRAPRLLDRMLRLSEHPDAAECASDPGQAGSVDVDDLAVTADRAHFYLVQRSTGRSLAPRVPHALDTLAQTPPLARFLSEIATARAAVFRGFDLGATRTLPYVPRIRYRRTVLSPARWRIAASDLGATPDPGIAGWRRRWRVPAHVVLVSRETRLPLDLEQPLDRSILLTEIRRGDPVEILEDDPPESRGWIGRRAELVIPMTRTTTTIRPLPVLVEARASAPPGSTSLVHARFTGNPARFDDLLTAHIPRFARDLGHLISSWWIHRHGDLIHPDQDQHLGLVLRLTDAGHHPDVVTELATFAADLDALGLSGHLTLLPAPPIAGRYGPSAAHEAAEQVFAADTAAAISQIAFARAENLPPQALAAASMIHLATSFAPTSTDGLRMLVERVPQHRGPMDRTVRDHALHLAANDYTAVRARPDGDTVMAAWQRRAEALTQYRRALEPQREPHTLLPALLHDHHTRAIGVEPALERETTRLARTIAQRHLALAHQP